MALVQTPQNSKQNKGMPRPDNKKAVECFLGCLLFFFPWLAEVAAPLRLLTEQSSHGRQHERALKAMITKAPVLKFYDVHDEATIQCDALEKGFRLLFCNKGSLLPLHHV